MNKTLATLLAIPLFTGCSVLGDYVDGRIELDRQEQRLVLSDYIDDRIELAEQEGQAQYFEMVNLLHQITVRNKTTFQKGGKSNRERYNIGTGFVVGDKYLSLTHVTVLKEFIYFQGRIVLEQIKYNHTRFEGEELELIPIIRDPETDVSVHQIPEELCKKYCNQGVEFNLDPQVGIDVFFLADPSSGGNVFRHAKLGRIDSSSTFDASSMEKSMFKGALAIDIYVVHGDSGSPVVDEKGRLIGVVQAVASGVGFIKPISQYLEHLTD